MEKDVFRKIIFALAVSSIALTATACKTVRGVGQDIQSAADAGSRATH
jgi:predicted small secreted protein